MIYAHLRLELRNADAMFFWSAGSHSVGMLFGFTSHEIGSLQTEEVALLLARPRIASVVVT
jgi:hypothetical protein